MCALARHGEETDVVVVVDEDRRTARAEPTLTLDERTHTARLMSPGRDWSMTVTLREPPPAGPPP